MAKDIKFNIKLNIDGKNVVVQASESVRELQRHLAAAKTGSERLGAALIRFNQASRVFSNISDSLGSLNGVMSGYISKANAATEAQTKLTTIMRQRMGATEADTAAINGAVAAQTKLGIVGGTVQRSGLQQLATFASHRATLETLLPAMNNLLAQQKGLNATSEDAVGVANLMGKALMGNVGALTRVGITLTDHQKELIKTGDEYTRATTLAQAITDNVGNMNSELAKTDAGKAKKAQMAFASLEVTIGKAIAPFQGLMNEFTQIGFAIGGAGQLVTAMGGLSRAIGITTLVTSMWHARTVMSTAVTNLFAAALNGASVGATTLKFALRGLMSATVIGAAVTLLSIGLEKLINRFFGASEASDKLKQSVQSTGDSFRQQVSQSLAPTLAKYQELQTKWKSLKSVHEKNQFIKTNKDAFRQLGVSIDGVGQAENFFVKNTKSVEDAMYARAEAAAAAALAAQKMQQALELQDKIAKDKERDKSNYKRTHHTGRTGEDLATDALIDNGGIKVTSGLTRSHEKQLASVNKDINALNKRGAAATIRADKGLGPYASHGTSSGGGKSTGGGGHTTNAGGDTDKKALMGSLDWYDQQMDKLRKQIYATNDVATAQGLQAQYVDLEQKLKSLKVSIGLEQPEQKEVKTYLEQLQDKLKEAQKQMDNAATIEARVAASANIDDIQHQIDVATRGEVTIAADVEPSYMVKGSEADKRQSYQNAQSKASNVQSMYDAGIISKEEAEKRIKAINDDLRKLGSNIKPVKLQIDTDDIDKTREALQNLGSSWGGINQVATGILDMVDMFKKAHKASQQAENDSDGAGKSFNALGSYAAAGATGLAAVGGGLQQIGGDGAAAKAGAVMAAIGQIILGFATYTAESAKLGPWGWIAAIASGTAILASTIATVKGYAAGGVLTGPTSDGDKILFRGNAGEMIFNTAQQRRLYAIANGNYLPKLPQMQTVKPKVDNMGDFTQTVTISVQGKLKGSDMELMGKNTRSLASKIGKRW